MFWYWGHLASSPSFLQSEPENGTKLNCWLMQKRQTCNLGRVYLFKLLPNLPPIMWFFPRRRYLCEKCGAPMDRCAGPGGGSSICPNGCTAVFWDNDSNGLPIRLRMMMRRLRGFFRRRRTAVVNKNGYAKCPHCGRRFSTEIRHGSWDGVRHTDCWTRLKLIADKRLK